MNYTGKIIVTNEEGIREEHKWGKFNKLLCEETTGDANFTFGELHYTVGGVRGPMDGHEAFHCLRGTGVLRAWPNHTPEEEPFTVPLRPDTEYYVCGEILPT